MTRKFSGKESIFSSRRSGVVKNIRLDKETLVPYFDIGFDGDRKVSAAKEFINYVDEPDPMTIPAMDD